MGNQTLEERVTGSETIHIITILSSICFVEMVSITFYDDIRIYGCWRCSAVAPH